MLCTAFFLAGPALGQQSRITAPEFDPSQPFHIEAERLEADGGDRLVRFEGDVVVKQEDATLRCDILLIYFEKQAQSKARQDEDTQPDDFGGEVEKLIAMGSVELTQGKRKASCQRAEYNHAKGTIALTGSPVVTQGRDRLAGSTILIYVPNQRVEILGGTSGRVSVTINPGSVSGNSQDAP